MFGWLGDIANAGQWLLSNWIWVAAASAALLTSQFWFPTAVRFFTETKLGMSIAAAVVVIGGGYLLRERDREANYQRGRADAERDQRVKLSPKSVPAKAKQEWWLGKK